VTAWTRLLTQARGEVSDIASARQLIEQRERSLKKSRSRFLNRGALDQWGGNSGLNRLVLSLADDQRIPARPPAGAGQSMKPMLDPNERSLLTSLLTPPLGMVFDQGLATTYSLDPLTLLGVPVHLAWMAARTTRTSSKSRSDC